MEDDLAFVIQTHGQTYKIYANGRTEGFPPGTVIMNRIPALIAKAQRPTVRKLDFRKIYENMGNGGWSI